MLSESAIRIQSLPRIVFGVGASAQLAKHVAGCRRDKALIVTDKGLVEAGIIKQLSEQMEADGLQVQTFDGVEPNPTDANANDGATMLKGMGEAAVVAVGGGSSMDCAKAISLLATNGGSVTDFGYGCKPGTAGQPVVAVPTTAGTGSETNLVGVITDTSQGRKIYVAHPSVQPQTAVLDPELTVGLPKFVTATCGIDVLTHAIEAYSARMSNPYVQGVAWKAAQMACEFLPKAYADGSDIEARSQMLLAASMAAIAFNVSGLGAAHGTGHPISARFHTAHGQTLATMLPQVMRFNKDACASKYAELAVAMGVADSGRSEDANADAAIEAFESICDSLDLRKSLRDLGATDDDIATLVEDALADLTMRGNPKKVSAEHAAAMYEGAMG